MQSKLSSREWLLLILLSTLSIVSIYSIQALQDEVLRLGLLSINQQAIIDHHVCLKQEVSVLREQIPVRFTSYYEGDSTRSGRGTSSGLTIADFKVNDRGWYTYQNRVVLGAATTLCLEIDTGACGQYNDLPNDYQIHELFDELQISIDGVIYDAIVLDSCGASFWNEDLQRYDIFVSDQKSVTDTVGFIMP